jgi:hypothetical protein
MPRPIATANVAKTPPGWCDIVMASSDKKGATVEFPFPGCVPASTMLQIHVDVPHPKIGKYLRPAVVQDALEMIQQHAG